MIDVKESISIFGLDIREIIDEDTGVHYMVCYHYGHNGNSLAITPMYNPNGTLKTDNIEERN